MIMSQVFYTRRFQMQLFYILSIIYILVFPAFWKFDQQFISPTEAYMKKIQIHTTNCCGCKTDIFSYP